MLTFLINLSCPKPYHMPYCSIRIIEYHKKKLLPLNQRTLVFMVLTKSMAPESEGTSPYLQQPTTSPHPKPTESTLHHPSLSA
jgi:hypothetical protein